MYVQLALWYRNYTFCLPLWAFNVAVWVVKVPRRLYIWSKINVLKIKCKDLTFIVNLQFFVPKIFWFFFFFILQFQFMSTFFNNNIFKQLQLSKTICFLKWCPIFDDSTPYCLFTKYNNFLDSVNFCRFNFVYLLCKFDNPYCYSVQSFIVPCDLTKYLKRTKRPIYAVQVNVFQKHLFLHQLTHNMTTDYSLNYVRVQYLKTTNSEHFFT